MWIVDAKLSAVRIGLQDKEFVKRHVMHTDLKMAWGQHAAEDQTTFFAPNADRRSHFWP
jgi:hypothetical protein